MLCIYKRLYVHRLLVFELATYTKFHRIHPNLTIEHVRQSGHTLAITVSPTRPLHYPPIETLIKTDTRSLRAPHQTPRPPSPVKGPEPEPQFTEPLPPYAPSTPPAPTRASLGIRLEHLPAENLIPANPRTPSGPAATPGARPRARRKSGSSPFSALLQGQVGHGVLRTVHADILREHRSNLRLDVEVKGERGRRMGMGQSNLF